MTIEVQLRAAYRDDALGIPARRGVMLSWQVDGDEAIDSAAGADVVVFRRGGDGASDVLWEASAVPGNTIRYAGPELVSREEAWFTVSLRGVDGRRVTADATRFEVGLEDERDWSGDWISAPLQEFRRETWDPAPLLRNSFSLTSVPSRARLYATALGVYRVWVNGIELSTDALLRPGWTDYRFRVLHQTYDVAGLLHEGENVVAVELARGWYAGRLGLQRELALYGEQTAIRMQVEGDAGRMLTATGDSWMQSFGDIMASDLLTGEIQDARQAQPGWNSPGFDDSAWANAVVRDDIDVTITPQPHESPWVTEEFEGVLVRAHARGPAVYDFGQNVIGWTRIEGRTLPKADLIVRHGEKLTVDDLVWRDNLRGAFQEDRYTTGDGARHTLEPRHTQHGFRYAEVWNFAPEVEFGALEVPDDFTVTALAITGLPEVGRFESSDPQLNAVAEMVGWTVRDNFLEVITDCPQRDERLGWLGDAGVIANSAAYQYDTAAFVAKFVRDAADSQGEDGVIRSYVPPVPPGTDRDGSPGWSDGYVRLVHLALTRYGDVATAAEHFDHIARYLAFVDEANPDGIRTERVGADFSDWLSLPEDPNEPTHPGYAYTGARSTSSRRVIATAHTIHSWDQFADIAAALGRTDDASRARARADELRFVYAANFLDERGWIEGDTQTAYAQALGYDILRGVDRERAVARLAEKVRALGHVTVGIHGSEHIVPALARNGHADLAEMLLMREEMPSWKHMVSMGGTTVWEKWDGILADGTMSTAEMNSFNHCALGAIGEFLYEGVAGLDLRTVASTQSVRIAPIYLDSLEWAEAEHQTVAGPVATRWVREGDLVHHDVTLAPGLTAVYAAPAGYEVVGSNSVLGSGSSRVTVRRVTGARKTRGAE